MPNGFVYNFVLQIFIFKFSFPVGNVQSFNLLFNLLFLAVFHPFLFFPPIQYFSLNPISWHAQNIHRILCPLMTPLYSSPLYISHISSVVSISFCLAVKCYFRQTTAFIRHLDSSLNDNSYSNDSSFNKIWVSRH